MAGQHPLNLPTYTPPASPLRIPKLQVRNRIEGFPPPPSFDPSVDEITPVNPNPLINATTNMSPELSPRPVSPPERPESSATVRPRVSSPPLSFTGRDSMISPEPGFREPKKNRFMSALLGTTEPSASAWDQYVKEQKLQAALKGSKAVGLSEKKLPESVPKVNSKWNGLPNHIQEPSRTSLDLSSFVRGPSRLSSESKNSRPSSDSKNSRPSTGKSSTSVKQLQPRRSGADSDSAKRPSRPGTSTRTKSDDTVRRAGTRSGRSTAASNGRGPTAMSTYSVADSTRAARTPPPLPDMDSMPEQSLFFPPDEVLPPFPSSTGMAAAITLDDLRDGTPTPTPRNTRNSDDTVTSEAPTMISDSQGSDLMHSQSDGVSQDSPATPRESFTTSFEPAQVLPGPRPKHFRSIDEIPQWPLPTKPDEVIIEADDFSNTSQVRPQTIRRTSSSSIEQLQFFPESETSSSSTFSVNSPVYSMSNARASSSIIPGMPSISASRRSEGNDDDDDSAPPPPPIRFNRGFYNPSSLRAPARLPGRVVTRDFDLATIAESDAASIMSRRSVQLPPPDDNTASSSAHMSDTSASMLPSLNQDTSTEHYDYDEHSIADSRASSEMSEQWFLTPRERLGLGGLIKHRRVDDLPWPLRSHDADDLRDSASSMGSGTTNPEKRISGDSTTLGALERARVGGRLMGVFVKK